MPLDNAAANWIEAQVKAMLSHFPQDWGQSDEVRNIAMGHWIDALGPFSRSTIKQALTSFTSGTFRVAPAPGVVRSKARDIEGASGQSGDISSLSPDERFTLENKVLPGARRWLETYPPSSNLHQSAKQTLEYWGVAG